MPASLNLGKGMKIKQDEWTVRHYPVASGQTFVAGDFVYLDSDGLLTICATASNVVGNVIILGIAAGDAAEALDTDRPVKLRRCPVAIPGEGARLLLQLYHGTTNSAVLADNEIDSQTTYDLKNQAGNWVIAKDSTSNPRIKPLARYFEHSGTDTYPWIVCRLVEAHRFDEGA